MIKITDTHSHYDDEAFDSDRYELLDRLLAEKCEKIVTLGCDIEKSRFDLKLAERYEGGYALVYRLCVDNYHRYCYAESGMKSRNRFIPGVLHTVRPIALENRPVFIENCREYTCIKTDRFGILTQMEVGAMLVGRIKNHLAAKGPVKRGSEKGTFLYGGSTIIVLVEPGKLTVDDHILESSKVGREYPVLFGQRIGTAK